MDLDSELSPPSAQEDEDSWPASPSLTMGNHRSKKNVLDALVHDEDSSSSRASPCLSLTSWERELRAEAGIQAAQYDELVERIPKIEITIEVPPVPSKGDYPKLTSMPSVVRVLEEFKENSALYFVVLMEDGAELEVCRPTKLLSPKFSLRCTSLLAICLHNSQAFISFKSEALRVP